MPPGLRPLLTPVSPPAARPGWGALKLSLMLQEANAVSSRLHGHFVFGRWVTVVLSAGSFFVWKCLTSAFSLRVVSLVSAKTQGSQRPCGKERA